MVAVITAPLRGGLPAWVGNGNGYGNGYGYGDGNGDGNGYGNGYGDGNGDGDGYGYGYGNGNGDGYGYGNGYGKYWAATVAYFAAQWPHGQRARLAELRASGARIAFWRSNQAGGPANGGGSIEPAAPGVTHRVEKGILRLCSNALHATLEPPKWRGSRWWIVALKGEVIGNDEKFGAMEREIIGECLD